MDFSLVKSFFHISPEGIDNAEHSVLLSDLTDTPTMREALEIAGRLVRAAKVDLSVSFLGMSAYNLVATAQLFLARYNRLPDLSPDNLTLQIAMYNGYAIVGYRMHEVRWTDVPEQAGEEFVMQGLTDLCRQTLVPFIRAVADTAERKPDMIWNQFGARSVFMNQYMQENEKDPVALERFNRYHALLTERLDPSAIGRRRNPFHHVPRYVDSPYRPGQKIAIRSSCCMYYCQEDGRKCFNCPKLTPDERELMREAIMAKAE